LTLHEIKDVADFDTDEEDVAPPPDDYDGGSLSDSEHGSDEQSMDLETSEANSANASASEKRSRRKSLHLTKRAPTTFAAKKAQKTAEEESQRETNRKYIVQEIYSTEVTPSIAFTLLLF